MLLNYYIYKNYLSKINIYFINQNHILYLFINIITI